ncbi:MAG: hypothetical protein KO202_02090 [Methanobacteriaceae archaeon]|jgi:hypothetical protein|nr:hypothetical protein [Methanobacteriaceae archaeon]
MDINDSTVFNKIKFIIKAKITLIIGISAKPKFKVINIASKLRVIINQIIFAKITVSKNLK